MTATGRGWLWLMAAGGFEVAFTTLLKLEGLAAGVLFVAAAGLSLWCMTRSLRVLPLGTVYPVWAALGAVGTVLVGIFAFGDPVSAGRLFFLALIVVIVILLKGMTR
jgi:quaternary ammonium compound-resistance protein SugE